MKKRTKEHAKKISEALKGRKVSPEIGQKISKALIGRKLSKEHIENRRKSMTGIKMPPRTLEYRKKMSRLLIGKNNPNWQGGITPINRRIRHSLEYRLWRESVFIRDDWTCIWCGAKSRKGARVCLNADHIKPFALYPELRFSIDNGRTLCVDCHKTTDSYGVKKIDNFLVC
jgi:5-methylcytosine-specific restriction endonuclease McrA